MEDEEGEEDEDALIEDGDEITHEDMATFHDIVCSWLKKVVKHVIINVLLEVDMNLEICAPVKGSFFRKGISQQDIDSRLVKLAVRCKGMVKALQEACNAQDMSEAIISFLQRLVAHRQKYPGRKAGAALAGGGPPIAPHGFHAHIHLLCPQLVPRSPRMLMVGGCSRFTLV